jgi:UDP-perosamine 4-acetyltransferase
MKVIGLGAGGHAKVLIDILHSGQKLDLVGLLDVDSRLQGTTVLGIRVLGDDSLLPLLKRKGVNHFFVGLGGSGRIAVRRRLYELGIQTEMEPVNAIHAHASVSTFAELGRGVTVMAGAVINAGVCLGEDVTINTGAIIEHDCVIGDHVHVAPGAMLAGAVRVGKGAEIGMGAVIRQGTSIGEGAIVGAGAVVVEEVADHVVVVGVPARVLRKLES